MTAHHRPVIRGTMLAMSAALLGFGLTGCAAAAAGAGGDAEPSAAAQPPTPPAGCAEAAAIDGVIFRELGGEPTDEAFLAVAEAFETAGAALHEGSAQAHEAAHAASAALTQAVDDGTGPAVFEDPAFTEATTTLGKFVFDECGYQNVEVSAEKFEFSGWPDVLDAGMTVMQLTNNGEDPHVIDLMRITDDRTTAEDIIADPEAAMGGGAVQPVGGGAFALPGTVGYLAADLEPGRYLVTCMIPDSENVPHAAHGMYHELTVE